MNIKKKIAAVAAAAVCGTNIISGGVTLLTNAEELTYGDLTYVSIDEDSDGTYDYVEITDCDENATEVEIPAEIDGLPVKRIGNWAFYQCDNLTDITILNSVDYVGIEAFSYTGLNKVIIPASVKTIEQSAFGFCENLMKVIIENPECIICEYDTTFTNGVDSNGVYFTGTIYGYKGSTAQAYADAYDYKFIPLDGGNIKGDVNYDSAINLYDAIEICRYIMEMRSFTDEEMAVADYNSDGDVNLYDVIEIAKFMMS